MVRAKGLEVHTVKGEDLTIIGCIGDTVRVDPKLFEVDSSVEKVMHVQEPYKLVNRAFHPDDTIVDVSGVKVGGGHLALIAGPCSVESEEQVIEIAKAVKASGANMVVHSSREQAHIHSRDWVLKVWKSYVQQEKRQGFRS